MIYLGCTMALLMVWLFAATHSDDPAHAVGQFAPPITWAVMTMGAIAMLLN